MFKNNSYQEGCNYSFREDDTEYPFKENSHYLANSTTGDRLANIENLLHRSIQIQMDNKRVMEQQGEAIMRLEKEVQKINRKLAKGPEGSASSRFKSQSSKTCRTKRSMEKTALLSNIEERTKAINLELSKRIGDQLEAKKQQKKPLRFFFPE